jgi:hypothetical protein
MLKKVYHFAYFTVDTKVLYLRSRTRLVHGRLKRKRLSCFDTGISVKKVELTVVTRTGKRFVFSESKALEGT